MRELERQVLMQVIDRKWREHLYEMDYLKEGIGLRAMAQRDPVIEYQREGFDMFQRMLEGIKEETVGHLFNVTVQVAEEAPPEEIVPATPQVREDDTTEIPVVPPTAPVGVRRVPGADPNETTTVLPNLFRSGPPQNLQYSGPTEDGEVARRAEGAAADRRDAARNGRHGGRGDGAGGSENGQANGQASGNRAERRRQQRAGEKSNRRRR